MYITILKNWNWNKTNFFQNKIFNKNKIEPQNLPCIITRIWLKNVYFDVQLKLFVFRIKLLIPKPNESSFPYTFILNPIFIEMDSSLMLFLFLIFVSWHFPSDCAPLLLLYLRDIKWLYTHYHTWPMIRNSRT